MEKFRKCLRCDASFNSEGAHHRICYVCIEKMHEHEKYENIAI